MVATKFDLNAMNERIQQIRRAAEELKDMGGQFPAVQRNSARILASTKMLELNVSDALEAGGAA